MTHNVFPDFQSLAPKRSHNAKANGKSCRKLTVVAFYSRIIRRKFRSQTSDNMDRWKAEMGRVREEKRREEKKREEKREKKKEDQKRESLRRKKIQVREKVRKLRSTVFFQWFVAPDGWKVGSLKRRVRSHLARWEIKSCTPLWREAHFEVKTYKTPQLRSTFRSCDVEKVHTVVVRSTFRSQNVPKHLSFGALLEVAMSKKCTPLWREAHFEVKMYKTHHAWSTFRSWDVEKVHAVVARGTFRGQNVKSTTSSDHFWTFRCRFAWQAQGLCTLSKMSKTWGFCSISKSDGRRGTFEIIWRGSATMHFPWQVQYKRHVHQRCKEVRALISWEGLHFGASILRDRCSTSYDLASLFRGRRSTLDRWSGKIAKRIGTRPSALHSTFHFWRKSRRIVSFLMLSS